MGDAQGKNEGFYSMAGERRLALMGNTWPAAPLPALLLQEERPLRSIETESPCLLLELLASRASGL